jgi:hypothetical protein
LAANEQMIEAARGNMAKFQQNAASAVPAPAAAPIPPPAVVAPPPSSAAVVAGLNPGAEQQGVQQQTAAAGKPAQGGPAATQQDSLATQGRNLGALDVLHDDGLGEVSGVVTDASGVVIAQASVSLNVGADKSVREVATGPDGRFRIADVPAGKYELRVSARGFNTSSQQVDLKAQDVAKLDSVLRVGTESQMVTVEANNAGIETQNAEATGATLVQDENLPGGAAPTARVAMGGRVLSVDAAGHVYLSRDAGKSWKKIKPKWVGKAKQLAIVPAAEKGRQVFELTTDAGTVWTSEDGKHWRPQPEVKQ